MSRNLNKTSCGYCRLPSIKITGEPYQGTGKPKLSPEYDLHWFVDCECQACGSLFTGWLLFNASSGIIDLSYRHSFNDEPDPEDIPSEDVSCMVTVKINTNGSRTLKFDRLLPQREILKEITLREKEIRSKGKK